MAHAGSAVTKLVVHLHPWPVNLVELEQAPNDIDQRNGQENVKIITTR
jgi:hypothetical protein